MSNTRRGRHTGPIMFGIVGLALAAIVTYVACSTRQPGSSAGSDASTARPACSEVFAPGRPIDFPAEEAAQGCLDAAGKLQLPAAQQCADGRRLYTVDGFVGPPAGWGFDGDRYHAVKAGSRISADPGFGDASAECEG